MPYNVIQQSLTENAFNICDKPLDKAAKTLFDFTVQQHPKNIVTDEEGNEYAKVAVSVDGTWMRRAAIKIGCGICAKC